MTAEQPQRSVVEELLVYTIYDWIDLGYLRSTVRELCPTEPGGLHAAVMGVVAALIEDGLVAAGDVSDEGFTEWNCTRAAAVARIDHEWRAEADPALLPFQVAALAPTLRGRAVIETVMRREGDDDGWRTRLARRPLASAHPVTTCPG